MTEEKLENCASQSGEFVALGMCMCSCPWVQKSAVFYVKQKSNMTVGKLEICTSQSGDFFALCMCMRSCPWV